MLDRCVSTVILKFLVIGGWILWGQYYVHNDPFTIFTVFANSHLLSWTGKTHDEMVRTGKVAF